MTKKPKQPETKKPAQPEPKPRRYGMVALAAEVPAIAKQALGKRGFAEAGLFTHWAEIAGAALAASSLPIKLSFPRASQKGGGREDGTLTVRCGGSAALELQHLAPSVLERINSHFGYRAVARLKIEQGDVARTQGRLGPPRALPPLTALEKGEIEQSVVAVENADIRATLTRLGSAIRRREKSPDKA